MTGGAWSQVVCALIFCTVETTAQVWLFPPQYRIILPPSSSVAISNSFEDCQALTMTKLAYSKGVFAFDSVQKTCTYSTHATGYILGNDSVRRGAWLGDSTSQEVVSVCAAETESFILELVYGAGPCPAGTSLSGAYCITAMPNKVYGVYTVTRFPNGTIALWPKEVTAKALDYTCDSVYGIKMTFDGNTWFCYTMFTGIQSPSYTTITSNECSRLQPGSSVIKFSDKQKECGFLTGVRNGYDVFLGLILPSGVQSSASAFKYFDGGAPGALPWGPGYPNSTGSAKNLVICDNTKAGYLRDVTSASLKALFCKKRALSVPVTGCAATSTTTSTSTSSTTITTPATTTQCSVFLKVICGSLLYALDGAGTFQNCSVIGEAKIHDFYMNECLPQICSIGKDATCPVYEQFAGICDAALPEGQKLDQTGSAWRNAYKCPAPTAAPAFVAGSLDKELAREAESAPVLEKKPLWDLEGDF